jgi:hypothetical protein
MAITGARATVSGKPGIKVTGQSTGLPEGTTLVPWFRFPGETAYTEGSQRPLVDKDGGFTYTRKTGKRFYVYVATEDGAVTSNRVTIAVS